MTEEKMTLFYLKRTGAIKGFCTGVQSMDFYGDEKQDYELIMDCIVIPYNEFLIDNRQYFKVINGELVFTQDFNLSQLLGTINNK